MKPIKGIISCWSLSAGRIYGVCEFHTTYDNGVERNQPITTSDVIHIRQIAGLTLVETKNSYYILV